MKRLSYLVLIPLLIGCSQRNYKLPYENQGEIFGLAGPVKLQPDTNFLYLQDYFIDINKIDSVNIDTESEVILSEDRKILRVISDPSLPWMMNLKFWIDSVPYSIPIEKSAKEWVTFTFDPGDKKYNSVRMAGEINGWNPKANPLQKEGDVWETRLLLNPGEYQYQLVLDGVWMLDPTNPDSVDNNAGGFNSVMKVGDNDESKLPFLYTDTYSGCFVKLGVKNADEFFVYWQNIRLPENFYHFEKGILQIHIPEQAADYERSYLRAWAINDIGISNDVLIPLENGHVIENTGQLNRHDHHAMILYNVFVDRFYNADPSNDRPLNIPEVLPPADYHGGDIKGVTEKIKAGYFKELGVNTIWISPLVKNPEGEYGQWPDPKTNYSGYHGYWPISFTEIDDRFGTEEEFMEMVEAAHQHDMNVLLDFVANHVHELHPIYQEHPDWATNLYLPDGRMNTQLWDEQRLTTWFDTFLPSLDLSNPKVVDMLTDSAVYWIKKYNLDGFRHDATKHIPLVFWRTLTRKLKDEVMIPEDKILYQIGETYGNPELIGSYVNRGMLEAQFDFNVYDDAIAVFAMDNQGFERLNNSIEESLHYYGDHNIMGYITGNQDRPRFISLAGGELSFEEDTKLAGWKRDIGVGDPVGYQKLSELIAFIMTIPGLPVIYYGDEIGMPGGNDPDNRRMMRFGDLSEREQWLNKITKKLIDIRMNNIELIYGDFMPLLVEKDAYVFMRSYFDQVSIMVFNNSDEEKEIEFKIPGRLQGINFLSRFENDFTQKQEMSTINLSSNSFDILTN